MAIVLANRILESVLLTVPIDGRPMLVGFAAKDPRTKVFLLNHEDACRSYENLINLRRSSLVRNDETDVTPKTVRRARFPFPSPATLLTSYRQPLNKEDEQCTESRSDRVANPRAGQSAKIEQVHK